MFKVVYNYEDKKQERLNFESIIDARNWVINHCDLSDDSTEIVEYESIEFKLATFKIKELIKELKGFVDNKDERKEIVSLLNESDDFYVGDYRYISAVSIDRLMQDDLDSDHYILGCCQPWFIADMTELDIDTIERAQKNESYELLGALLAKDIEAVQEALVSNDGYGGHFAMYDSEERKLKNADYYYFKIN